MQLFDERLWKIHQAGEGIKMEIFFEKKTWISQCLTGRKRRDVS